MRHDHTVVAPSISALPLDRIAVRVYLGGHSGTPSNLRRWIRHPRTIDARTVMPDLGVTDQDVRDIAAFLFTLRCVVRTFNDR